MPDDSNNKDSTRRTTSSKSSRPRKENTDIDELANKLDEATKRIESQSRRISQQQKKINELSKRLDEQKKKSKKVEDNAKKYVEDASFGEGLEFTDALNDYFDKLRGNAEDAADNLQEAISNALSDAADVADEEYKETITAQIAELERLANHEYETFEDFTNRFSDYMDDYDDRMRESIYIKNRDNIRKFEREFEYRLDDMKEGTDEYFETVEEQVQSIKDGLLEWSTALNVNDIKQSLQDTTESIIEYRRQLQESGFSRENSREITDNAYDVSRQFQGGTLTNPEEIMEITTNLVDELGTLSPELTKTYQYLGTLAVESGMDTQDVYNIMKRDAQSESNGALLEEFVNSYRSILNKSQEENLTVTNPYTEEQRTVKGYDVISRPDLSALSDEMMDVVLALADKEAVKQQGITREDLANQVLQIQTASSANWLDDLDILGTITEVMSKSYDDIASALGDANAQLDYSALKQFYEQGNLTGASEVIVDSLKNMYETYKNDYGMLNQIGEAFNLDPGKLAALANYDLGAFDESLQVTSQAVADNANAAIDFVQQKEVGFFERIQNWFKGSWLGKTLNEFFDQTGLDLADIFMFSELLENLGGGIKGLVGSAGTIVQAASSLLGGDGLFVNIKNIISKSEGLFGENGFFSNLKNTIFGNGKESAVDAVKTPANAFFRGKTGESAPSIVDRNAREFYGGGGANGEQPMLPGDVDEDTIDLGDAVDLDDVIDLDVDEDGNATPKGKGKGKKKGKGKGKGGKKGGLKGVLSGLGKGAKGLFSSGLFKSLLGGAGVISLGADIFGGVGSAEEWFGDTDLSSQISSGIGAAIGGTGNGIMEGGFLENAQEIGGGVLKGAGLGSAIGSIIPGVGTVIGGAVGAGIGGIGSLIGGKNIADFIKKLPDTVGKWWDNLTGTFGGAVGEWWTGITGTVSGWWTNVTDTFGGAVDSVKNKFGEMYNQFLQSPVGQWLQDTYQKFLDSPLGQAVQDLWSAICDIPGKIGEWIQGAWTSITEFFNPTKSAEKTVEHMEESGAMPTINGTEVPLINGGDYVIYSNAGGLSEVPFDNYATVLHKGEAVLTAEQADIVRNFIDNGNAISSDGGLDVIQGYTNLMQDTVSNNFINENGEVMLTVEQTRNFPVKENVPISNEKLNVANYTDIIQNPVDSGFINKISNSGLELSKLESVTTGVNTNLIQEKVGDESSIFGEVNPINPITTTGISSNPAVQNLLSNRSEEEKKEIFFDKSISGWDAVLTYYNQMYDPEQKREQSNFTMLGNKMDGVRQVAQAAQSAANNAVQMASQSNQVAQAAQAAADSANEKAKDAASKAEDALKRSENAITDALKKGKFKNIEDANKANDVLKNSKAKEYLNSQSLLDPNFNLKMETDPDFMQFQINSAASFAGLDVGTPFVPQDEVVLIHQGEMVVPANINPYNGGQVIANSGGVGSEDISELIQVIRWGVNRIEAKLDQTSGGGQTETNNAYYSPLTTNNNYTSSNIPTKTDIVFSF